MANPQGDVCCPRMCGGCGESGCSSRPGGRDNCCREPIREAGRSCLDTPAPCVLDKDIGGYTYLLQEHPVAIQFTRLKACNITDGSMLTHLKNSKTVVIPYNLMLFQSLLGFVSVAIPRAEWSCIKMANGERCVVIGGRYKTCNLVSSDSRTPPVDPNRQVAALSLIHI